MKSKKFIVAYAIVAILALGTTAVTRFLPQATADTVSEVSYCNAVTPTDLTAAEVAAYGGKAKAFLESDPKCYDVNINGPFRIVVSAAELVRYNPGGKLELKIGFNRLPSSYIYAIYNGENAVNQKTQLIPSYHQVKTSTIEESFQVDISDYNNASINFEVRHDIVYNDLMFSIQNPIDIAAIFGVKTGIDLSYDSGYTAINSSEAQGILDTAEFKKAGLVLFDFNFYGDKSWRSTERGADIANLYPGLGYYVYNPGAKVTINVPKIASGNDIVGIRRGWNLLSNKSGSDLNLANISYPTLKNQDANQTVSNACTVISCFETKSLKELFSGTSSRAYSKIYIINDPRSTDASIAFQIIDVTGANIDSTTIPAGKNFWIYLFD